jgi:PAS domain S-box-containing protein
MSESMRVLIVDDDAALRTTLGDILRIKGFAPLPVGTGRQALEEAGRQEISVAVIDLRLGDMSGLEVLRRLRQMSPEMECILLTGHASQDSAIEAVNLGAYSYLRKPYDAEQLLLTIRRAGEKRQVVESLRKSEAKYRRLHESMTDAFVMVDMEGRLQEWNHVYRGMLGYTDEELGRLTYMDLTPERWREMEERIVAEQILPNGYSEVYEKEYCRRDGSILPVELHTFLLRDGDGRPAGMWAIVRDISQRRKNEQERQQLAEQLRQSQKLEAVGRLAGGVAHDFNNLLSVILGYGEIVLEDLHREHPAHEMVSRIYQAGVRARELTRQLLAFSRKQVLEMHVVNLNAVVSGFDKLLRRVIGEDIELRLALSARAIFVRADTSQLEQVLMNLGVNGRDAMPDGGVLTIETGVATLDEHYAEQRPGVAPGEYAMICVSDTGCGMDSETMARIFEPFFTTKATDKGTGLGLATSYGIVKQHGGNIWVYSEPGRGATFKVYLPLAEPNGELKPREAAAAQVAAPGNGTILLVEDNEQVRDLAGTILRRQGYTVLAAENGWAALELMERYDGPVHLLLTDVVMPGMSGGELSARLTGRFPGLRVLYMSGYTENVICHRGVAKPGVNFIQKPFSGQYLTARVRQVLEGERA